MVLYTYQLHPVFPLEFAVAESDRVYSKLPEDRSVKWGALYPRTVPG